MRISFFRHFEDNAPRHEDHTWESFCAKVIGPKHKLAPREKEKCPLFSPAEFEPGAVRNKNYVARVHLAVLDYDHRTVDELEILRSAAAHYRSVLYSSYNHLNDEDPVVAAKCAKHGCPGGCMRVRLVYDLSRPVEPAEWLGFWQRLTSLIPIEVDQTCKDESRMYVLPYTPHLERAILVFNHDAPVLDVEEVLAIPAPVAAVARANAGSTDAVSQPVTVQDLKDLVARYKKTTRGPKGEEAKLRARWFEALINGQDYAYGGTRHTTMLRLTAYLEREFPRSPLEAIADLFELSLRNMGGPDFDVGKERLEVFRALKGAREQRLADEAAFAEARERGREAEIREAFRGERDTEYTEAELDTFAEQAGTDRSGFRKRWIVVLGKSTYIYVGGQYRAPVPTDNLILAARRDLAPATGEAGGVSLSKVSAATGLVVRKTREEVLDDYGTAARAGVASFALAKSYYDPKTQTIYEAVCPPRQLEPAYSEAVDGWLERLGGDLADTLRTWLVEAGDLNKPLAALYLEGGPGVGKSMFAEALSREWGTTGPTSAVDATGEHNDIAISNPVVKADEAFPPAWVGAAGLGRFREFVAADSRSLNRKHIAKVRLHGCLRVVLAANNLELLGARLQLTPNDRAAILERILHIEVPAHEPIRRYLAKLGNVYERFVHGDEFARHVRWLRANRAPQEVRPRFGVEAIRTKLHDEMKAAHETNSAVGQWLVGYLLDKAPRPSSANIMVKDGRLCVNVQALQKQDAWSRYVSNPRDVPPPTKISKALIEFADRRIKRGGVNLYAVLPEVLHGFADALGVTPEAIDAALVGASAPGEKILS